MGELVWYMVQHVDEEKKLQKLSLTTKPFKGKDSILAGPNLFDQFKFSCWKKDVRWFFPSNSVEDYFSFVFLIFVLPDKWVWPRNKANWLMRIGDDKWFGYHYIVINFFFFNFYFFKKKPQIMGGFGFVVFSFFKRKLKIKNAHVGKGWMRVVS